MNLSIPFELFAVLHFIQQELFCSPFHQIDKYFLIDFWESSKINYSSIASKDDIEDVLEKLVADKEIEKTDGKYYLIDNGDIPSVFYLQD